MKQKLVIITTEKPTEKEWIEAIQLIIRSYDFCFGGSAFNLTKSQAKFINKHTDMKAQEKY